MEINFHFNAPAWPSAGGLWEAAVKSFKFHLKRVLGEHKLTYEEFSTLLAQIEGCLNSRPLCALSDDPEDLNYLTPSHFLTSGPLLTLVQTETDLRTRWYFTQKITQDIWKRWSAEYLTQLTSRSKWKHPQENLKINDVVLVQGENLPPGKWVMGRVMELHPGKNGYVRVVTLKTQSGYMKRPVVKLSKLVGQTDNPTSTNTNHVTSRDETYHENSKAPYTRKAKPSLFTSMITTFLLFLSILSSSEAYINITRFRENQGLYFDKLSNMFLIKNEWKLIVYYEMEPYLQGNKALDTYVQTLDKTCKTMKGQGRCDAIVLQLRHGYEELKYYNQLLLSQQFDAAHTPPETQRRKRGLINGVGYLANTLFGVLDNRFAEQYKKDIDLLQQNQNHILNLWKNQTTIVESENNLLRRTESTMNQQHKIINQHMMALDKAINELKNTAQANNAYNDFTVGSIIATNVLNNLKGLQNTLLDTIMDVYHGRFNLHLVTPQQLIKELSTISSKLPKDVSLPIDNIHLDIRKLYNLIKVKARMLEEYLLFEIRIPLITRETYEIFKLIPVPKYRGNKTIILSPVSRYVAMNIKKDTFIPLSETDIKACFIEQDSYYCHGQKPEYQMKNYKNLCEQENQDCLSSEILCKVTWQESYIANTYIYTCCDRCHIRTMCDGQITAHQLTATGLISVDRGCIIKTEEFAIYPHIPHTSEVQMSPNLYTPTIAPINHIINISIPQFNLSDNPQGAHSKFKQDISTIDNHIQILKNNEVALPESVSYHDIHHYAMIYSILGILAVIGLIIIIKRTKCKWSRHHHQTSFEENHNGSVAASELGPAVRVGGGGGGGGGARAAAAECASPPLPRQAGSRPTRLRNQSTSPVLRKFHEMFNDESV